MYGNIVWVKAANCMQTTGADVDELRPAINRAPARVAAVSDDVLSHVIRNTSGTHRAPVTAQNYKSIREPHNLVHPK